MCYHCRPSLVEPCHGLTLCGDRRSNPWLCQCGWVQKKCFSLQLQTWRDMRLLSQRRDFPGFFFKLAFWFLYFTFSPPIYLGLTSSGLHVCWHINVHIWCFFEQCFFLLLYLTFLYSVSLHICFIFFFPKVLSWILSIRDCGREISVVLVHVCVCTGGWKPRRKDFRGFLSNSKTTTRNTIIVWRGLSKTWRSWGRYSFFKHIFKETPSISYQICYKMCYTYRRFISAVQRLLVE